MLCFVLIGITGRCQNYLVILSILSIFHLNISILMVYLIFKKIRSVSLSDLIAIRDRQLFLPPLFFSSQQFGYIIDYLCTS